MWWGVGCGLVTKVMEECEIFCFWLIMREGVTFPCKCISCVTEVATYFVQVETKFVVIRNSAENPNQLEDRVSHELVTEG